MASDDIQASVNRGASLAAAIAVDAVAAPADLTSSVIAAPAAPAANAAYVQADLTTLLAEVAELKLDHNTLFADVTAIRTALVNLLNVL